MHNSVGIYGACGRKTGGYVIFLTSNREQVREGKVRRLNKQRKEGKEEGREEV